MRIWQQVRQHHRKQTRKRELRIELLCDRIVLDGAGLGVTDPLPWFDPGALTYSFAPDGTGVAGHESQLFATLNALADSTTWQAQFDAAFNAWLSPLNATIRPVEDSGAVFGVAGPTQGDVRFGDVRIAAIPLSEHVLATSVPHSAMIQGTWAGDILINADAQWHDLQEVFAVALHEFGHVLGLSHSQDPTSPMFVHGVHAITAPTVADLKELQNLYVGIDFKVRHDASESGDFTATEPEESVSDDAASLAVDGDSPSAISDGIPATSNVDVTNAITLLPSIGSTIRYAGEAIAHDTVTPIVFRLDPTARQAEDLENLHVAWRSSGVELMDADVTIVDASGRLIESRVLHHGQGSVIVQALRVDSEMISYVVVSPSALAGSQSSQFELVVDYGNEIRLPRGIGEIKLDSEHPALEQSFSVSSSRLVHLHLEVPESANEQQSVQAMLLDADNHVLAEISMETGSSRSAPITFLAAGDYKILYVANANASTRWEEIRLNVYIDEVSIDVGPGISNPTGLPYLPCGEMDAVPGYCYIYVPIKPSPPVVPNTMPNPIVSVPITPVSTTSPSPGTPITSTPITSTPITSTPITSTPITSTPTSSSPVSANPTATNPTASDTGLSPWQNPLNPYDVNRSASVTAHDALVVINLLGRHNGQVFSVPQTAPDFFADVNGDRMVSAADALMVINALAFARVGELENAGVLIPVAPPAASSAFTSTRRDQTVDSAISLLF